MSIRSRGVKPPKAKDTSTDTETKTISKDSSLLKPKTVESGQAEHDERHRAMLSGVRAIQQAEFGCHDEVLAKPSVN